MVLLASCLVLPAAAADNPFTDVSSKAWYAPYVQYVYDNGLMNGTSSTKFSPNTRMNRAMLVTVLYRMDGSKSVSGTVPFTDIKAGDYYEKALVWAYQNGIITGTSATKFSPNAFCTREMMVAIFYRYANYLGMDTSKTASLSKFTDAGKISEYAVKPFQWAIQAGVITGNSATTLNPLGTATRAECSALLKRFCELKKSFETVKDLEPVTLKIWFHGSMVTPEASASVMQAVNAYLGEKINVTLEPIWGTWGDFDYAAVEALYSGSDCDIFFTSSWSADEYAQFARDGFWVRLDGSDDLLGNYAPELLNTVSQDIWNCSKINGSSGMGIYAVPALRDTGTQNCWDINAALLSDLGYDPDKVCASGIDYYSDAFEEMLRAAKEKKGSGFYPLVFDPALLERMVTGSSQIYKDLGNGDVLSYYFDAEHPSHDLGSKIVNKFATPEFKKFAERTYYFAQQGYISPANQDLSTVWEYRSNALDQGNYLFSSQVHYYDLDSELSASRGFDVRTVPTSALYLDSTSVQGSMMAISANSKNPERAMMFLNLLNTDPKLMTMLNYGTEGFTYTIGSNGLISFTDNRLNYTPWMNGMGNIRILPPTENEGADYWDRYSAFYDGAEPLPIGGFTFDISAVSASTRDSISGVYNEYAIALMSGAADPETALPEFLAALEEAGMSSYVAEANAQLQAFLAG